MRIIGGKFKGRTLFTLPDKTVRPTTDRVKESIFNLVQFSVAGACVLDLFAGSGALGIECISRGAKEVVFVDKARASIETVKANLEKVSGEYSLMNRDFRVAMELLRGKKFDLIFLDPPYADGLETEILQRLVSCDLLAEGASVILERDRDNKAFALPCELGIADSRDYGGTTIDVIKKMTKVAVTGTFDPFTKGHRFLVDEGLKRFDCVYVVFLNNPQKETEFPLKKRMRYAELSLKDIRKGVFIDSYDGLAIDYCKKYGIKYIIRGIRNAADEAYERQMADYNKTNGDVETIFVKAENGDISSTKVRELLREKGDLSPYIVESALKELKKEEN